MQGSTLSIARMDFTSVLIFLILHFGACFVHIGLSKSAYVSNGIGVASGLMSTGSLLAASIATVGAFDVVTVGFSSDMDEWLIACTDTVDVFASEHAGGMMPIPRWVR